MEVAHIDDGASLWHVLHGLLGQADHAHNVDHEGLFQAITWDVPEVFYCVSLSTNTPLHDYPDTKNTPIIRRQRGTMTGEVTLLYGYSAIYSTRHQSCIWAFHAAVAR